MAQSETGQRYKQWHKSFTDANAVYKLLTDYDHYHCPPHANQGLHIWHRRGTKRWFVGTHLQWLNV